MNCNNATYNISIFFTNTCQNITLVIFSYIERNTLRYKRESQIAQNTSDKYRNSELHKMEDLLMNDNLETVQLLPLTSDIVFKQVFGQEESKPFVVF